MQDAIFSRGPEGVKRTGMFIAGKRAVEALDMMDRAKKAMVPPFEISVFADPAGSFTTAAAMVACVKKALREKFSTDLKGKSIAIFGGTGVVGFASAVIAAREGAKATLIGYDGPERVKKLALEANARFGRMRSAMPTARPRSKRRSWCARPISSSPPVLRAADC